ncbi:DUF6339 family protein [Enterovibrio norvegicus]|uniref:DUF6339 family protein n=1 Tax=Enterovibrio norvegicus TaxID=188144 RepID=UPI003D681FCD
MCRGIYESIAYRFDLFHRDIEQLRKLFFATHLVQYRDDNGIARLWWSSWIAKRIDAENPRNVLSIIFSKADIRSNIIERSGITTRKCLITHLIDFVGET